MDGDSDLSMFKEGENEKEANKDIATQLLAKDITHNQTEPDQGKSIDSKAAGR